MAQIIQTNKIISERKYNALKRFDFDDITEEIMELFSMQFPNASIGKSLDQIKKYEETKAAAEKERIEYLKALANPKPKPVAKFIDKEWLWKEFKKAYLKNEGVDFISTPESLENLKPLIFYFIGDFENFKKCKNVSSASVHSMKKGLLIIGSYGNGKTSIMKALEIALKVTQIRFKAYSTNEVVNLYEACDNSLKKDLFNNSMERGTIFFDDVLTERNASNYGTVNLIKDILEKRNFKKRRTYITCNYADNTGENLQKGLEQFAVKYGSRVYDRLFHDFNIIEFSGKSFRK
jgi:DNA replication protein DnaC